MTFREVLLLFRETSGRYDLVDSVGTDTGAGFYINAGIRHLDRITNFQKSPGRYFQMTASGTYLVRLTGCRSIKEVWINTGSSRVQLDRKEIQDLRISYTDPWAQLERGVPAYYTPTVLRPIPERISANDLLTFGDFVGYMDVVTDGHEGYNGLLLLPPADGAYLLEVWGNFYSKELSDPTDVNSWTVMHPEVAMMAGMMQLEIVQRNSTGVKDWDNAIRLLTTEIEKDSVEEEVSDMESEGV